MADGLFDGRRRLLKRIDRVSEIPFGLLVMALRAGALIAALKVPGG